ncbi:hypothetical protein Vadar_001068 [Vaccinium darrowii]|uniref:Uncharacterized protein n=1 Tax=Vaccinium darrowii TaxID=229202 RepID=A0ACB7YKG4_9ERIC|nr:hypothetical protein Vadar_001068 [Vaccinium darrowii]
MLIFFILFFLLHFSASHQEDCTPTRCSDQGLLIRFPFRLKNHQPPHCGYPGFDLSCSPDTTSTILNLPYSVEVLVTNIDYESQLIHIKDANSCFPQQLQNLNLSATPFQFADSVFEFSLFSCPSTNPDFLNWVTCLSDDRYVYPAYGDSVIYGAPLISCRKMYNLSSVPSEAFDQTADVQLKWPPWVCGNCEAEGKFCRFMSNTTNDEIECFGNLNPPKKGDLKRSLMIASLTIGSFLLLVTLLATYWFHRQREIKREDQRKIERRALIYEFLPNDSLEKFGSSHHDKNLLGWSKMLEIAMGIAKGIEYLHQGCNQQILHFDIKPHNILLDDNLNPKISDFGQAKLCSKEQSIVSMTTARGTIGYIAPEVFSRNFGNVSYKADIYSFGMLLLEMVGGKKNFDVMINGTDKIYFPEWIYNCLDSGEELAINIQDEGDAEIAKKLAIVGLWCIQWYPIDRPSMHAVIQMLERDGDTLIKPPNPFAEANPAIATGQASRRPFTRELDIVLSE